MTDVAMTPPRADMTPEIKLLGQPVVAAPHDRAIQLLLDSVSKPRTTRVAFFNSNLAVSLERLGGLRRHLDGFIVMNDGLATDIAGLIAHGRRFPNNLNGTDLTPDLLARLPPRTRVFLYGARPHVICQFAALAERRFGVAIVGAFDGYGSDPEVVRSAAVAARPDVVLVALGNPKQELWIRAFPECAHGVLVMGVGALFDFMTQEAPRAPPMVRRLRAEWLYRLVHDPRRLGRRYTIDMAEFFWRVVQHRYGGPG